MPHTLEFSETMIKIKLHKALATVELAIVEFLYRRENFWTVLL